MGECNTFISYISVSSVTALTVCRLFSLIFIGGAADLETSDFARVAKIFFKLAETVCTAEHCFHWFSRCNPSLKRIFLCPNLLIRQKPE